MRHYNINFNSMGFYRPEDNLLPMGLYVYLYVCGYFGG